MILSGHIKPLVSRRAANCYTTRCIISDRSFLSTILGHEIPIGYALDISSSPCTTSFRHHEPFTKVRLLRTCSIKTTTTTTRIQSGPKTWGNQRKAADFGPALKPFQKNRPARRRRDTEGHTTYTLSLMSNRKISRRLRHEFFVRYIKSPNGHPQFFIAPRTVLDAPPTPPPYSLLTPSPHPSSHPLNPLLFPSPYLPTHHLNSSLFPFPALPSPPPLRPPSHNPSRS